MKHFDIKGKSLDLGCGDGILSFIRAGGRFDITFDDYQSIGNLDKFFKNFDVHDTFNPKYSPKIIQSPNYKFSIALDQKHNLISKAKKLNFYNSYIVHDANKALPFPENTFDCIFSNILYWLDNPNNSFREIARVLKEKSGKAAIMLPNSTLTTFSFYNNLYIKNRDNNYSFLKYLDRGRHSSNIKSAKSFLEWKTIIERNGLKIVEHKMHLSKSLIQIWDIGLRPLFPVLVKMVRAVENENKLTEIKQEWIEIFLKFLDPIFELEMHDKLDQNEEKAFHYFLLEKSN